MGSDRYEVAIREPGGDVASGEMRRWTVEEIGRALPWLKRANAQGRDVLIRPATGEEATLVMVEGLDAAKVEAMKAAGREPAVVVEASPGQLEAWVRVPACDAARREAIGRQLAKEQGVDPKSAVPGLYGRLAGFTNRGAGDERRQPWVLCRESSGKEARVGPALVKAAGQEVEFRARVARERGHSRSRGGRSRDGGGLSR